MAEQHGPGDEDAATRDWQFSGRLVGDLGVSRPVLTGDDPLELVNGFDLGADVPVDLGAVRADDALLDALGGGNPDLSSALAGHELSALLLSWRRDVDNEPFGELVDTETAARTVLDARRAARRRPRLLVPLATAAAVLAIAFTGVSLAARDARPGDALWGLTQMLYTDHAHSIEAAVAVESDLNAARSALSQGRIGDARTALANAKSSLPLVSTEDGRSDLSKTHQSLVNELNTTVSQPTSPSTPSSPTLTSDPGVTSTPPTSTTTTLPTTTTTTPSTPTSSSSPPPSTSSSESAGSGRGNPPDPSSGNPPNGGTSGAGAATGDTTATS
ncbi:anti-sigma-D factor RsdA [Kutzneria sp. NPDC052558]|uniref:anti-sigma-D factor RsdA n=1 Tax=Kutzneria sp. NPDC052558 TaxID=3364121 RepID=UPI0037CB13E6